MSSSLWSSLPVTALLRGQQKKREESFLSAAQRDQDEEREGEKEDFLLAAQGPNLLLLPWEDGEPYERLQVFHSNAIHGLQWVGSGIVLVRGGKSRATVKVKM